MAAELEELVVPGPDGWRDWLEANHRTSPGVWLVVGRKGGSVTGLDYEPSVIEALCFGWIDGQARRRDEESYFQRYSPRTTTSRWSQSNVDRVAALEAAGLMREAGAAAVAAAKSDGRWAAAIASRPGAAPPEDLAAAIAATPAAQAMYEVLTSTNRQAIIYHVVSARKPETRVRRVTETVAKLARQEAPFPQKAKP